LGVALPHKRKAARREALVNPNGIFGQQLKITAIATARFAGRIALIE
jgi:hypothetical protein